MEENEILKEEVVEEVVTDAEASSEVSSEIDQLKETAQWYALHTYSGYENVAKENLEIVIDKYSLQLRVFDIIIPMEDVVEEKKGKRIC